MSDAREQINLKTPVFINKTINKTMVIVTMVFLALQFSDMTTAANQQADQQGNTMLVKEAYNFRKIDDRISTSGLLNEDQLAALSAEGYEALINLLPSDSQYAIKQERAIVEQQGVLYRHIPVDFSNPTASDYGTFESAFEEFGDKKVIIHCAANFRVSAFFSIYAYKHLGWSREQVDTFIATIWNPREHPVWLSFIESQLTVSRP